MTQETEELGPVLRCLECAEPVVFIESTESWAHDVGIVPLGSCYDIADLIQPIAGTFDGPWDVEKGTYSTHQGVINNYKAKDRALQKYCGEDVPLGKTWADLLQRKLSKGCGCPSCNAKLNEPIVKSTKGGEPQRSGGPDDPPVHA